MAGTDECWPEAWSCTLVALLPATTCSPTWRRKQFTRCVRALLASCAVAPLAANKSSAI